MAEATGGSKAEFALAAAMRSTVAESMRALEGDRPARRRAILIVDDQPVNIQALYQIFHDDYDVFMATSGAQALQVCRQKLPDLILLDVIMPQMDGLEVCRQLKADAATREIPVIFVTSQDSPDDETRGLDAGGVDFISKPVNPAVVKARVRTHITLKEQSDLLRSMAFFDGLSGVANRRYFDVQLDADWRVCRRDGASLAVVLLDVDNFKAYNDRYGHAQGDACLQAVAGALQQQVGRGRDLVARYGGEEFAALLPNTDLDGAVAKAEAFREAVESLNIRHEAARAARHVTISVGVAAAVPGEAMRAQDLLRLADEQLYRAKRGGRNRVEAQPTPGG